MPSHPVPHPATTAPAGAALITGASTGIGAAAAAALAGAGYFVWAGVRSPAAGEAVVAACGGPGRAAALRLDVADPASIVAATLTIAAALESTAGGDGGDKPPPRRLAALVNNAGVSMPGPLLSQPAPDLEATLAINLGGALAVTRAVGPLLGIADAVGVPGLGPAWRRGAKAGAAGEGAPALPPLPPLAPPAAGRGRPLILNISSVAGRVAAPFMGAYAASKHGLEGASDALRREVAPFGVEVVVLGGDKGYGEKGGGGGGGGGSFFWPPFLHAHTPNRALSSFFSLTQTNTPSIPHTRTHIRAGSGRDVHLGQSGRAGHASLRGDCLGPPLGHLPAPDGRGGAGWIHRGGGGGRHRLPGGAGGAGAAC